MVLIMAFATLGAVSEHEPSQAMKVQNNRIGR
jgi:hypothetical protein